MEKGVLSMMMLVCFLRLATTIALDTVSEATISYSMKPYRSSHIHGLYHDYLHDRVRGRSASVQPHDFVLKEDEGNLEHAEFTASSMDAHDRRDVEALLSFRKALTSDPDGSLLNWTAENSDNVCSWNGIFCRKRTKRVVAIILPGLGLQGSISPSLCSLSLLRILNLSGNNLTGTIPPEFGQLKALGILDLSFNLLRGFIPKALCNCTRLQWIRLSVNSLTGSIPTEFGRLVKLEQLRLSNNNLSGSIPTSLSNCTSLQGLSIGYNNLTGPIPSGLNQKSILSLL
jgi:hypothetical protein